jgi:hypothetical protein
LACWCWWFVLLRRVRGSIGSAGRNIGIRHARLSYPTLAILSVPLFLALSQSVGGRILYGIGRLRWFTVISIAQAVVNLLLSIALIGPLGIEGGHQQGQHADRD